MKIKKDWSLLMFSIISILLFLCLKFNLGDLYSNQSVAFWIIMIIIIILSIAGIIIEFFQQHTVHKKIYRLINNKTEKPQIVFLNEIEYLSNSEVLSNYKINDIDITIRVKLPVGINYSTHVLNIKALIDDINNGKIILIF